jgi:hypothetical protein
MDKKSLAYESGALLGVPSKRCFQKVGADAEEKVFIRRSFVQLAVLAQIY